MIRRKKRRVLDTIPRVKDSAVQALQRRQHDQSEKDKTLFKPSPPKQKEKKKKPPPQTIPLGLLQQPSQFVGNTVARNVIKEFLYGCAGIRYNVLCVWGPVGVGKSSACWMESRLAGAWMYTIDDLTRYDCPIHKGVLCLMRSSREREKECVLIDPVEEVIQCADDAKKLVKVLSSSIALKSRLPVILVMGNYYEKRMYPFRYLRFGSKKKSRARISRFFPLRKYEIEHVLKMHGVHSRKKLEEGACAAGGDARRAVCYASEAGTAAADVEVPLFDGARRIMIGKPPNKVTQRMLDISMENMIDVVMRDSVWDDGTSVSNLEAYSEFLDGMVFADGECGKPYIESVRLGTFGHACKRVGGSVGSKLRMPATTGYNVDMKEVAHGMRQVTSLSVPDQYLGAKIMFHSAYQNMPGAREHSNKIMELHDGVDPSIFMRCIARFDPKPNPSALE